MTLAFSSLSHGMVEVFRLNPEQATTIRQGMKTFGQNPDVQRCIETSREAFNALEWIGNTLQSIELRSAEAKQQKSQAQDTLRVVGESRQAIEKEKELEQRTFTEQTKQIGEEMRGAERELTESGLIALGTNPLASRPVRESVRIGQYALRIVAPLIAYTRSSALSENCLLGANASLTECASTLLDPWAVVTPGVTAAAVSVFCTKLTEFAIHIERQEARMRLLGNQLQQAESVHKEQLDRFNNGLKTLEAQAFEANGSIQKAKQERQALKDAKTQLDAQATEIRLNAHTEVIHDQVELLQNALNLRNDRMGVIALKTILNTSVAEVAGQVRNLGRIGFSSSSLAIEEASSQS